MLSQTGDPIVVVNCAENTSPAWRFLEDDIVSARSLRWVHYACDRPMNRIERLITKPKLSRYRACFQAAWRASRSGTTLIITHLPRATASTALFGRVFRRRPVHVAFSFNFTKLPTGLSKRMMTVAFRRVSRFVVYSAFERSLYSEYFGIPDEKFDVLLWAMERPVPEPSDPLVQGDYLCALGGEGRDYTTLFAAMAQLPHRRLFVIARPYSLPPTPPPANVTVMVNEPIERCWNLLASATASVVPLLTDTTNCGHITFAASSLLGRPIITTRSHASVEYSQADVNALVSEPHDVEGLAANLERVSADGALAHRLGQAGQSGGARYDLSHWISYIATRVEELQNGSTPPP